MRPLSVAAVLLVLLAPARETAGQSPPTGADVALKMTVAKTLLEEGKKLLETGDLAEAKEKLEASIRNDPSPAALLALGICQEKLGATASAWGTFQRAAQQARLQEDMAAAEEAARRASALEPRLSKVKVVVTSSATEPKVLLDDRYELGKASWGTPLPLDPGWHTLAASAPGRQKFSTTFQLRADGDIKEVVVPELEAPPLPLSNTQGPIEPPPPPAPPRGVSAARVAGITLTATGATGIFVGLATACIGLGCYPGHSSRLSRGEVAGIAVATAVSAGVLALGISILFTEGTSQRKGVVSIRFRPIAVDSGSGLGLGGTF